MKIGIPRGLAIYEYQTLFIEFFKNLNIEVVMSDKTNREILKDGINNSLQESCLASKIFMGHVANLVKRQYKEKIDYIFIPRICSFENSQTICVKFYAIYDICKNVFDANFVTVNVDYNKNKTELKSFISLGRKLNKSIANSIRAYILAKKSEEKYNNNRYIEQTSLIKRKTDKLKVLIVSHPYVLYDEILGKRIINILKKQNIEIFFANINSFNMINPKIFKRIRINNIGDKNYEQISNTIFWKSSKNLLNGISTNLENIDGIIYLSVFPCGTDSLVNELAMRKITDIPSLNLLLDEQDSDVGIHTRIESFLDILSMNKNNNIKVSG